LRSDPRHFLGHLVEAQQPFEMIGYQLSVVARLVVETLACPTKPADAIFVPKDLL